MGLEIFKTDIVTEQEANYLLHLLRRCISDSIIYFYSEGFGYVFRIQTNREISDVACSLFMNEGFNCQKL